MTGWTSLSKKKRLIVRAATYLQSVQIDGQQNQPVVLPVLIMCTITQKLTGIVSSVQLTMKQFHVAGPQVEETFLASL